MLTEERRRAIAATIAETGKITVAEIATTYGISDESARRDLCLLEGQGLCRRTRGGAIAPGQVNRRPPADRDFAAMPIFPTYRAIARIAATRIKPHDTVYLPGGSFGHILVPFLPTDFPYTAVINSVELAHELRPFVNFEVYVAGGRMRQSGTLTDSLAAAFVERLHFDLCFMTGAGLTAAFGLSNGTDETAAFQRTVIAGSRRACLLIPGQKVGADAFIRVCPADAFDEIITDWEAVEEELAALGERGITVTVAEEAAE